MGRGEGPGLKSCGVLRTQRFRPTHKPNLDFIGLRGVRWGHAAFRWLRLLVPMVGFENSTNQPSLEHWPFAYGLCLRAWVFAFRSLHMPRRCV